MTEYHVIGHLLLHDTNSDFSYFHGPYIMQKIESHATTDPGGIGWQPCEIQGFLNIFITFNKVPHYIYQISIKNNTLILTSFNTLFIIKLK